MNTMHSGNEKKKQKATKYVTQHDQTIDVFDREINRSLILPTSAMPVFGTCLESAHVSWISGVLKTVLIAFHEELEKEPAHNVLGLETDHSAVLYFVV